MPEKVEDFNRRLQEFFNYKVSTIEDIKKLPRNSERAKYTVSKLLEVAEKDTRIKCPQTGELYVWQESQVVEAVEKMQILIEDIEECSTRCARIQRHQEQLGKDGSNPFENLNELK
jgi:hypothetical protein